MKRRGERVWERKGRQEREERQKQIHRQRAACEFQRKGKDHCLFSPWPGPFVISVLGKEATALKTRCECSWKERRFFSIILSILLLFCQLNENLPCVQRLETLSTLNVPSPHCSHDKADLRVEFWPFLTWTVQMGCKHMRLCTHNIMSHVTNW